MKNLLLIILTCITVASFSQGKSSRASVNLHVVNKPVVVWSDFPKDTAVVSSGIQAFSTVIKSRLPLDKVEIRVNNILTDAYQKSDFAPAIEPNRYEQKIVPTLTLRNGMNNVQFLVKNTEGVEITSGKIVYFDPTKISTLRNEADKNAPMIYVSNPSNIRNDYVLMYEDMVKLTGTVIDEAGIQELKVGGLVAPIRENGSFSVFLPLNVGQNSIVIEAKDINQNISLKKFTIERRNTDGVAYKAEEAKNYLLVIGVNKYKEWPKLNNAVSDATSIVRILTSQYKFEPDNTTIILDAEATRKNINDALRQLIEKVTPNDNLMIYYSGHGYFDKLLNEGYWVPVDGGRDDHSGFLANAQILKIIENINSHHTLLVADACFSGSLFASSTRGYADNMEKFKSRWGLASGRLEVVSDGDLGQNSPFAKSVIEFLATNKAPKVSVSELVHFVKQKVSEVSNQTPIGSPLKNVGDEGGEFIFYKR